MFTNTNESIHAVLFGMAIRPSDLVIAVGGSGDQAFAFLEYGDGVIAVDKCPYQVAHIRRQAESLRSGDYRAFWSRRGGRGYFEGERLERIRPRIPCLRIAKGDIVDVCMGTPRYTRVYLSNALNGAPDVLTPRLRSVSMNLREDGLVYGSNGETISDALEGSGLVIDEVLSGMTRDEGWHPIVLRKSGFGTG